MSDAADPLPGQGERLPAGGMDEAAMVAILVRHLHLRCSLFF
ncbi:hypothetical protein RSWS8N_04865 [Cereibacter sphaeroides WS8N]|nr:hypothetical protein RSWS8N_04865 [Cereibacter sphaeroides WS8N]